MEQTFPFSEANKIEIISYPLRYTWDTIVVNGHTRTADVVKDKKLQVNPIGIKDRVVLDSESTKKLFKFFFTESRKKKLVSDRVFESKRFSRYSYAVKTFAR